LPSAGVEPGDQNGEHVFGRKFDAIALGRRDRGQRALEYLRRLAAIAKGLSALPPPSAWFARIRLARR